MRRVELTSRWSRQRAVLLLAFCGFAVLGWQGVSTVAHQGPIDAAEHLRYAQFLASHHRLPNSRQNYEFGSPPLFQATAVAAEELVRVLPAIAAELPWNPATRGLWLALVAAGAAAMTATRRRARLAGLVALALGFLWGLDELLMLCKSEKWTAGQLIALASGMGLVFVSGLIAREVWPAHPRRALAAGGFVAAYPVVYRMSILFHPEVPFALLCAIAMLLFLRAARRGWPTRLGWLLGAACGAAALTRQPAVLLIACLGAAALATGGRPAHSFLLRAAIPIALIAGPWWLYATYRWHNPLQSNLALAPAKMLPSEPASFYLSAPLESLVVHPYRPDFTNELLPKLHSDLWSDWYGALEQQWRAPTRVERVTASTQSVLGLFGDALALAGLAALAVPAGIRAARRRARSGVSGPTDLGLGLLALVALAAFVAFVFTVIRFPQRSGDPIKSSYLLFTAPCWAIFSVAAWTEVRRRWRRVNALLVAVAVLYAASYAAALGDALAQPASTASLGQPPKSVKQSTKLQQGSWSPGARGPLLFPLGVNGGRRIALSRPRSGPPPRSAARIAAAARGGRSPEGGELSLS
ncbi:MAG TPA: glycosyltransferase family 39 protein [Gaiellaceae bacterium]|nr:glycosyltransferase family 39 protein [Gaiellaceae bacterium]